MIECCLTNQSGTLHASNHWFIPFKHECPSRNLTGITYCIGVSLSCKNTDFFHTESQVISYTKIRRYSAQVFCSILRFINSVHGSDPLSARFFPFSRKTGANYLYIGLSLSFQLSGFLLIFSVNVKLFRACHLSKKGETFLPRDFLFNCQIRVFPTYCSYQSSRFLSSSFKRLERVLSYAASFFIGLSSEQQRRKKSGSVQLPSDSFLSLMDLASAASPIGHLKGSSILLRSYWEPSFGCLFISLPDCIFSIAREKAFVNTYFQDFYIFLC